jgi:hypothetical protein
MNHREATSGGDCGNQRPYRKLEPGRLKQLYERVSDGRRLTVIRRRGFGQYVLGEFPNRSIGVFVHRGDSPGDGGSNTYFLANNTKGVGD